MCTVLIRILFLLTDLIYLIRTECWLASQNHFEHQAVGDKGPCI